MKIYAIVMASGRSKRFGGDKLNYLLDGKTVACRSLEALRTPALAGVLVVTGNPEVSAAARALGFSVVDNPDPADDQTQTIRLGLSALSPDADGCLFAVCDQPWLTVESVERLCAAFVRAPEDIWALAHGGRRGNPVIFPAGLLPELSALPAGETGRYVIARHPALLCQVEAPAAELRDVDTRADLEMRP